MTNFFPDSAFRSSPSVSVINAKSNASTFAAAVVLSVKGSFPWVAIGCSNARLSCPQLPRPTILMDILLDVLFAALVFSSKSVIVLDQPENPFAASSSTSRTME